MAKYVELGQGDNRDVDLKDVKLVKLLPETEQLVVEPTTEEQSFKPSAEKYFDDVKVGAIQTESITIEPKTTEQTLNASNNKFYDTIHVGAVTSDIDNNIQEYNIRKGVTILGKVGNVEVDKPDQEKVVSASIEQDTIVMADTGYELAKVTIPRFDISGYVKEEVGVDVNPSEIEQVLIPGNNQVYNRVNIGAIPSNYVGSSIARVPEQSYIPTTTDIEIQANQFLSGKQTIKGDTNLIPENIAEGKEIFGILGTHQGGVNPSGTIQIEENGNYDVTNYANAEVNVEIVKPSGTKTITENGTHDVEDYAFADVSVEPNLQEKTVTVNGEVVADSGYDGLSKVTVIVPSEEPNLITKEITENGTYTASDEGADGYSEVVVNVPQGNPIEVTTDTEMTNALVEDNLGKLYKFNGTSDTYETDAIYIVSEVE